MCTRALRASKNVKKRSCVSCAFALLKRVHVRVLWGYRVVGFLGFFFTGFVDLLFLSATLYILGSVQTTKTADSKILSDGWVYSACNSKNKNSKHDKESLGWVSSCLVQIDNAIAVLVVPSSIREKILFAHRLLKRNSQWDQRWFWSRHLHYSNIRFVTTGA